MTNLKLTPYDMGPLGEWYQRREVDAEIERLRRGVPLEFSVHCECCRRNKITLQVFGRPAPPEKECADEIDRLRERERFLLAAHTGCGCEPNCAVCREKGFT